MSQVTLDAHSRPDVPMILKGGSAGAWYLAKDFRVHIDASMVKAIDTAGAGEMLAGVYLSLRTLGLSIIAALENAVAVASAKVTEFGVDGAAVNEALSAARKSVEGHFEKHFGPFSSRCAYERAGNLE